jgi:hypothetical protein
MSAAALLDQERLAHLQAVIAQDVAAGRYFGAVITRPAAVRCSWIRCSAYFP